jgi:ankyrin repeat protein
VSDALELLYAGDVDGARARLPPDDELTVFEAAAFGRVARLRELLGADPAQAHGFSDDGFTALHLAGFGEQEEAARVLIACGADVHAISTATIAQVTPLGTATFVRSLPLARLLLESGADPNLGGAGSTPIEAARANGDDAMVALLTER